MSEENVGNSIKLGRILSETKWNLYVGIDFGTHGCGISYTLPKHNESYIHNMWGNNDANKKSKTTVLLNENNRRESVGNKAEEVYFNSDSESPKRLFKAFKMNLYDDTHKTDIKKIHDDFEYVKLNHEIRATNDPNIKVSSGIVFIVQLQYLRNEAFKFIDRHLKNKFNLVGNVRTGFNNVQYFLTVPGIFYVFI